MSGKIKRKFLAFTQEGVDNVLDAGAEAATGIVHSATNPRETWNRYSAWADNNAAIMRSQGLPKLIEIKVKEDIRSFQDDPSKHLARIGVNNLIGAATGKATNFVFGDFAGVATGEATGEAVAVGEQQAMIGVRSVPTIGKLTGFSQVEEAMLKTAGDALRSAGYNTAPFQELIRADMPKGYRAMALSEGVRGAALGQEAFSSQAMLNHVLEEELLHLYQKADGLRPSFRPGTAKALEEAADAARRFPLPEK